MHTFIKTLVAALALTATVTTAHAVLPDPGMLIEKGRLAGTLQAPTLIVWGKNDYIFPAEGAHPYKRDLRNLEFHLLDTGHFALEEHGQVIAEKIRRFLNKQVAKAS